MTKKMKVFIGSGVVTVAVVGGVIAGVVIAKNQQKNPDKKTMMKIH
ncbi:hypothetical protein [Mycoplasmopsis opalescens]|nr:hypothetical protein [Mycoplasmopsis opalescens]